MLEARSRCDHGPPGTLLDEVLEALPHPRLDPRRPAEGVEWEEEEEEEKERENEQKGGEEMTGDGGG